MPDTGAPWNIPYVAGTDLVSDWPTDSQSLATAIADGLDAAGNAGIGSNVVQSVVTASFATTSSSMVDVTGLTVNFTPTSDTSKVLVLVQMSGTNYGVASPTMRTNLVRDSTNILVGDSEGSRGRATTAGGINNGETWNVVVAYLDSPATTSAVTYKIQIAANNGGTVRVNADIDYANLSSRTVTTSTITAIEVAA